MGDTQSLRNSHPSLPLGQSIQFLEDELYLVPLKQLSYENLRGTLRERYVTFHVLKPPLLDLSRCQAKYRKQFDHYFDNDLDQHRSRRNLSDILTRHKGTG